jgi:FkbM family methyltransferase
VPASRSRRSLLGQSYLAVERGLNAAASSWAAWRPFGDLRANGGAAVAEGDSPATIGDVVNCYRLLLGRQPDPDGLAHYRQRLSAGTISLRDLVGEFLGSVEFVHAHPQRREQPTTEIVTTCEGFRMHVDPSDYAVGHTIARTGSYEPEVSAALREVLGPGGTFVDAGANIGWFSMLGASLVGPSGRVIAVEPNPINVGLLRDSAKDNGFDNIDVLTVALAARPGSVALETDGSNGRVTPIDGPPAEPIPASFVVAARPLDDVLSDAGVTRVDAIKIDVEGAEPLVLKGAGSTITRHRPVLISEFYPLALDSSPWGNALGYLAMLRAFGYRLSVIGSEGDHDDETICSMASRTEHVDLLARPI